MQEQGIQGQDKEEGNDSDAKGEEEHKVKDEEEYNEEGEVGRKRKQRRVTREQGGGQREGELCSAPGRVAGARGWREV